MEAQLGNIFPSKRKDLSSILGSGLHLSSLFAIEISFITICFNVKGKHGEETFLSEKGKSLKDKWSPQFWGPIWPACRPVAYT